LKKRFIVGDVKYEVHKTNIDVHGGQNICRLVVRRKKVSRMLDNETTQRIIKNDPQYRWSEINEYERRGERWYRKDSQERVWFSKETLNEIFLGHFTAEPFLLPVSS